MKAMSRGGFSLCIMGLCLLTVPGVCWADNILISSIEDLQKIGNDPAYPLNGDYVLTQDIDASATAAWNNGAGFAPIGTDGPSPFTGSFDGQAMSYRA